MTFKEVANRITGISIPVFGISWNPPKLERQIAEKVIVYLEDKRILYNPYELEVPKHCIESISQIRVFLTEQLYDVERGSELGNILRAMRDACRKLLDMLTMNDVHITNAYDIGLGTQMVFYSGVGELRGVFGILIAKLLVMHGIDCESNLVTILPLQYLED
ncbi:DUF6650 family protein [uncultured Spirosoma sp.]|uniref:DUF6650 family protein n=1 Tax=uncultured Spirosoma sp. TaxID=278208 RepID=UPI00258E4BE4|nr:DUF6650 family protein [uncultured Spirosoma sp.]